jgi:hypothetical protein
MTPKSTLLRSLLRFQRNPTSGSIQELEARSFPKEAIVPDNVDEAAGYWMKSPASRLLFPEGS